METTSGDPRINQEHGRVAIVHDWLTVSAGAEKVLARMLGLFPNADLYALVDFLPIASRGFLGGRTVKTSFIQGLPGARRHYRNYLPLMPLAVEQWDMSGYDLVLSSSHAVAKGVITGPDQVHVSYVHSPLRYAWDLQHQYLREAGLTHGLRSFVVRALLHYMRLWDSRTAVGVDALVANSSYISRRIRKVYGRDVTVVYPPVDVRDFAVRTVKKDYYLTASRLVPYKRIPLIVEALRRLGRPLIVAGEGPEAQAARKAAAGSPHIRFVGYQGPAELARLMGEARAFLFAAEEDFGITPLEAMACGTPVIAYGRGGACETVIPGETGWYFSEQTPESLMAAIEAAEACPPLDPMACRRQAERFSPERFDREFLAVVAASFAARHGPRGG